MIFLCTRYLSSQENQYRLGAGTEPKSAAIMVAARREEREAHEALLGWLWDAND